MAQVTWSEGAWVVNMGVEGMNGATCGLSVGIDGLGGTVDGVGSEVNDASSADEMEGQFLHVLGYRGLNYGMWGQCGILHLDMISVDLFLVIILEKYLF